MAHTSFAWRSAARDASGGPVSFLGTGEEWRPARGEVRHRSRRNVVRGAQCSPAGGGAHSQARDRGDRSGRQRADDRPLAGAPSGCVGVLGQGSSGSNCGVFLDAPQPCAAESGSHTKEASMRKVALALVVVTAAVTAATAVAGSNSLDPRALTQARKIKAEITARYVRRPEARRHGGVPDRGHRVVPPLDSRSPGTSGRAGRQRHPLRDLPRPCHLSLPGTALGPTGERLTSLAGRRSSWRCETFLETSATVVSVSLPDPGIRLLPRRTRRALGSRHVCARKALGGEPSALARRISATNGRRDHSLQAVRAARPRADAERRTVPRRGPALALGLP